MADAGGVPGRRVGGDLGDLAQQVEELADLADEVAAGEVVVAQHLVELVALVHSWASGMKPGRAPG